MNEITFSDYVPGAIGRIVELHGEYYSTHWGLGRYFEAKVAAELGEFMGRFDPNRDGAWLASVDDRVAGGIFIDGLDADGEGARLRWFIVDPAYHGRGLGRELMQRAMAFCDRQRFPRVYLTTFAGLDAARHLYEAHGFAFCHETDGAELTGTSALMEQVFEYFPHGRRPDAAV